jgi:hypothetical protein
MTHMALRAPPRRLRHVATVGLLFMVGSTAIAQRTDSARVAARQPKPPTAELPDSLRPPLSPRRAFLYSFVAPGYGQAILGRHKAAALMLFVEGLSIAMIRESAADVSEARRLAQDTTAGVVVSWVDPATGNALKVTRPPLFTSGLVKSRQSHVEDWAAFLIANHLFSGADAYVAANLWDVPAQLALRPVPNGAAIVVSIDW